MLRSVITVSFITVVGIGMGGALVSFAAAQSTKEASAGAELKSPSPLSVALGAAPSLIADASREITVLAPLRRARDPMMEAVLAAPLLSTGEGLSAFNTIRDPARQPEDRSEISLSFATPLIAGDFGFGLATRASAIEGAFEVQRASGAELRFGQRLEGMAPAFASPSWDNPTWYLFAATDGQALAWTPEMAPAARPGLSYQQERVMVGDLQAGLSLEANGLQASFSYIQREISNGRVSDTQNFTGVSLTMKR